MSKHRFNKDASLDEGEVILEYQQDDEVVAWTEPYKFPVDVQEHKSDELTQADLKWAKTNLSGNPHSFDAASVELLERLCRHGIAADFGADGFGRGHKFYTI